MRTIRRPTNAFKKDFKRVTKRDYDHEKFEAVLDLLRRGEPLTEAHRDHLLKGEWKGWRECHVAPDWLLIYKISGDEILLARTGTHADLFGT